MRSTTRGREISIFVASGEGRCQASGAGPSAGFVDVGWRTIVFADLCPPRVINSGIRGLPPGFDLGASMRALLDRRSEPLREDGDEQGLQVASLFQVGRVAVVTLDDVTICSPFPPHVPHLGQAGAHFVGLNTRRLGFGFDGRPAEEVRAEHGDRCVADVACRVQDAAGRA